METREEYNSRMRVYLLKRYHTRMNAARVKLGGECVVCGDTKNLQLDHIDPSTKTMNIAGEYGTSEARFWAEIAKCQLLCAVCHTAKTIVDRGFTAAKGTHGTLSAYRYCKCALCKKAKSDYSRAAYKRKQEGG